MLHVYPLPEPQEALEQTFCMRALRNRVAALEPSCLAVPMSVSAIFHALETAA